MKEFFTYDAFISYRHADLDQYVADRLHKRLEAFKLPHSASRNRLEGEKTKIRRIFRDKNDLPIASDLASPIMTALNESEYLIVICSPRTPESIQVKREIETFISLHGREHVLAVLIEGEPEESFPPALLTARKEVTLEDGTKTIQKIAVEPMAADIRGKTRRDISKNIKKEMLRLAAPMFDCSYSDLKQRHRQRKIKRIVSSILIVNALLICFGCFSTIQAVRLSKQTKQIQQQSAAVEKQSAQITEQYQKILVSSLNTLADTSLRFLDEGDRMKSILAAKAALPASSQDQEIPLVPHAEYALADSLYVYENESQILSDRALDHDTDVQFMVPSPSGERLLTVDSTNIGTIWDTVTGELVTKFIVANDSLYQADEDSFTFVSENELVYYADSKIKRYNYETKETLWETDDVYLYAYTFSPDKTLLASTNYEEIRIYNLESGSVKLTYRTEANPLDLGQVMSFSPDSKRLALTTNDIRSEGTGHVDILQLSSGSAIQSIATDNPYICSLLFTDNNHLAIAANAYIDMINNPFISNNSGDILLYQVDSGIIEWTRHFVGQTLYTLQLSLTNNPFLIATSYDTVNAMTLKDGSLMGSVSFSSAIVDAVSYNNNTYGYCATRDGNVQSINYDGGVSYDIYFESQSNNIKSSVKASNYIAMLPYASHQIVLYRYVKNQNMEDFIELDDDSSDVCVSQDGTICFVTTSTNQNALIGYDYLTKKELFHHEWDETISHAIYAGSNDQLIILCFTDHLEAYDSRTGEMIQTAELADYGRVDTFVYHPNRNQLYTIQERGLCTYNIDTLSCESVCESNTLFHIETASAATTYDGTNFVISNRLTGMLEQYDTKNMTDPKQVTALNTNYVTNLFYSNDGNLLFVVYKNRHVDVYQASDFSLIHTYTDLNGSSTRYIPVGNADGDYILANNYQGYLCTKDHKIKAYFPHFRCLDSVNQKIISHNYRKLNTIPVYDLDMLLKEANRQLNGRTLTEDERAELYLQ